MMVYGVPLYLLLVTYGLSLAGIVIPIVLYVYLLGILPMFLKIPLKAFGIYVILVFSYYSLLDIQTYVIYFSYIQSLDPYFGVYIDFSLLVVPCWILLVHFYRLSREEN